MVNPAAPVPSFNGTVVLKVSRLSANFDSATPTAPVFVSAPSQAAPQPPRATTTAPSVARAASSASSGGPVRPPAETADVLGLFDSSTAVSSDRPAASRTDAAAGARGVTSSSSGDIFSLSSDSPVAGGGSTPSAGAPVRPGLDQFDRGSTTPIVTPVPKSGGGGTLAGKGLSGGPARGAAPGSGGASRPASGGGNILAGDIFTM
jgi:hypothetical protein